MTKQFAVYILASGINGTLYSGVTSNLLQRTWKHKNKVYEGFTKKYSIDILVWYELHESSESAITREKRIKKYKREQKIKLITENNPDWNDLYETII
jgi:putative endonuclease